MKLTDAFINTQIVESLNLSHDINISVYTNKNYPYKQKNSNEPSYVYFNGWIEYIVPKKVIIDIREAIAEYPYVVSGVLDMFIYKFLVGMT